MRWEYRTRLHKQHFACFQCRKAFKRRWPCDYLPRGVLASRPFPCPQCGQPMNDMGVDFKAPPRNALRQWLKVAVLYSFGILFDWDPVTGEGRGPRPATLRGYPESLLGIFAIFKAGHGNETREHRCGEPSGGASDATN